MVSAGTLLRAPRLIWQVEIQRKPTCNEYQNSRKRRVYVRANDEAEAKAEALRQHPEFMAVSARRST